MNTAVTIVLTILPIAVAAGMLLISPDIGEMNLSHEQQVPIKEESRSEPVKSMSEPSIQLPEVAETEAPQIVLVAPETIPEQKELNEPAPEVMTMQESVSSEIILVHPSIETTPRVAEPGSTITVSGKMFMKDSDLSIMLGDAELFSARSDADGNLYAVLEVPYTIADGIYALKVSDSKGTAMGKVIVKTKAIEEPAETEAEPSTESEFQQVTIIPDAEDNYPPTSSVIINGEQHCYMILSVERCWYHDYAPVAEFFASDDRSGVKHISVLYNGQFYLQSENTLTLNRYSPMQRGNVTFTYFAVDQAGNAETPKTVSMLVDPLAPDLYVRKIRTDSNDNVRIGTCKIEQKSKPNCIAIPAKVKETVTFDLLLSDLVSGVNSTYYRIVEPFEISKYDQIPWVFLQKGVAQVPILELSFEKHGNYFVQIKTTDNAGNESNVQTYYVKVTD